MTLLTKGPNIIKKLSGSSYLLEIDKLTEEHDNLIIILDNNVKLLKSKKGICDIELLLLKT